MHTTKIAITIEETLLRKLDGLVESKVFPNRSKAVQAAVSEKISRIDRSRLAKECAKLDKEQERTYAEEGMTAEHDQWPKY